MSKQETREMLRAQAPELAAFVDEVRAEFGNDTKVTYLKVGDYEAGTPIDQSKVVEPPAHRHKSVWDSLKEWQQQVDEQLASEKRMGGKKRVRRK